MTCFCTEITKTAFKRTELTEKPNFKLVLLITEQYELFKKRQVPCRKQISIYSFQMLSVHFLESGCVLL